MSEILFSSNGKSALLLVRGKFRLTDLQARFKSNGVTPSNYKGHDLFGDDRAAITFLDDSTAAAGTTADIRALIDQRSGKPAAPDAASPRRFATCCAPYRQTIRFMPRSPAASKI